MMLHAISTGFLTGIAFGVLLYKVGATRYSRIMGMLTLRDTKVMKFAFTAIAVASMIYGLASVAGWSGFLQLQTRVMPYLGPAHLLGGVLFGVALGFTGLCPGTCASKAGGRAGGKRYSGIVALVGLFAGVLLFAMGKGWLVEAGIIAERPRPLTLHGYLGLPYGAVALVLGAAVLSVVLLVDRFTPEKHYPPAAEPRHVLDLIRGEWSFAVGGSLAGLLIVLSTMQGEYLGFSGSLLALVGTVAHAVGQPLDAVPRIDASIAWRASLIVGALVGGYASTLFSTYTEEFDGVGRREHRVDVRALGTIGLGTMTMALGALIGGGCTTGAFLSAWPTLSLGSFAMAMTFFATSMAVSNLRVWLRALDLGVTQSIGERVYD